MKALALMLALAAPAAGFPAAAQTSYPPPPAVPTTFSGTTCTGCTMADPVFTGTPTINGSSIVTAPSPTTASGLAYFHRYPSVVLTIPAVGVGGTGTGTASVPGTAAGDQCFVAPVAATTLLSSIMGAGWVSTAGTVKVALAAPSLVAISAGTAMVNLLCAQ